MNKVIEETLKKHYNKDFVKDLDEYICLNSLCNLIDVEYDYKSIIEKINEEKDPYAIYGQIYKEFVQPCYISYISGDTAYAYDKYVAYMNKLKQKYLKEKALKLDNQ